MGWRPSPQMDSRSWTEVKVSTRVEDQEHDDLEQGTGRDRASGSLYPEGTEQLHDDGPAPRWEDASLGQGGAGHQGRRSGQHDSALSIGPVEAASTHQRDEACAAGCDHRQPGDSGPEGGGHRSAVAGRSGERSLPACRFVWASVVRPDRGGRGQWRGGHEVDSRGPERPGREVPAVVPDDLREAVDVQSGRAQVGGYREVPLGVVATVRWGCLTGHGAGGRGQGGRRRRHDQRSKDAGELVVRVQGHIEVVLTGGELVAIGQLVAWCHLGNIDGDGELSAVPAPVVACQTTGDPVGANCRPTGRAPAASVQAKRVRRRTMSVLLMSATLTIDRAGLPLALIALMLPASAPTVPTARPRAQDRAEHRAGMRNALVERSPRTTADQAGDTGRHHRQTGRRCRPVRQKGITHATACRYQRPDRPVRRSSRSRCRPGLGRAQDQPGRRSPLPHRPGRHGGGPPRGARRPHGQGAEGPGRRDAGQGDRLHHLDLHHPGRDHRRLLRGGCHRAGPGHEGGVMRGVLQAGAFLGFVVAALGLTWEALAIVGVLYLLERAEAQR